MTWTTIQQILRILGFVVAGVLFGIGWIDEDTFMQLISGTGAAVLLAWWAVFNQRIEKK